MYSRCSGHEALSSFWHVISASTAGRILDTISGYPESDLIELMDNLPRLTT